jgi:GTP cyclohydrolase I
MSYHQQVISNKIRIVDLFGEILTLAGFDIGSESLQRTPERQWEVLELITRGYDADVTLERMYDDKTTGLPTLRVCPGIKFISVCEHHFQAFIGEVNIAFIPNKGRVPGLSKLPQLVQKYALRPQLQERMTQQIADELCDRCELSDVMVVAAGQHMCEIIEGYWRTKPYVTSTIRGLFVDNEPLRYEALTLMGIGGNSR